MDYIFAGYVYIAGSKVQFSWEFITVWNNNTFYKHMQWSVYSSNL